SSLEDFENVALRGRHIIDELRGTNTVMGGFIKVGDANNVELFPMVQTTCGAAGPPTDEAVEYYMREIARGISEHAEQFNGVLLFLHCACWSPSYQGPERAVIDAVRTALGPDKPIVVALDYHGNIDAETFANADAAFAYRKSPHADAGETGERASDCMLRILRKELRPVIKVAKPGVLVPSIFSATALTPLADIISDAAQVQASSDWYLDISVMAGFSYTDAHNTGFAVLAVSDQHAGETQKIVDKIAGDIHAHRHTLYRPVPIYTPIKALNYVQEKLSIARSEQLSPKP